MWRNGKRKRRYRYKRNVQWPGSNRYRHNMPIKYRLLRVSIIFIILLAILWMLVSKKGGTIDNKLNKSQAQELSYTPMQERIAALEVPPEVSSKIFEEAKNNSRDVATLFATYIVQKEKGKDDESILNNISKYRPGIFASKKIKTMHKEARECYQQFIVDLEVFPISIDYEYAFENSWNAERTYGGIRKHYGTDIMDSQNERGIIPIVSMTQGTVENIGWNNMGGYRVGVRTKSGGYMYYAHLDRYAPKLKKGTKLEAGDLIGYMGDSGYGEEGTIGEFPVHLHIGIATKALGSQEAWVNPYYLLKYLEDKDIKILKSRGIF